MKVQESYIPPNRLGQKRKVPLPMVSNKLNPYNNNSKKNIRSYKEKKAK